MACIYQEFMEDDLERIYMDYMQEMVIEKV